MTERAAVSFEEFYENVFDTTPVEQVVAAAARRRPPARLCGELWREGELAVLFGESGTGKSVFAAQAGFAIAAGRKLGPLAVDGRGRSVLYIDLKLDNRQWGVRYAEEYDAEDRGAKRRPSTMPAAFERVAMRPDAALPDGFTSFTQPFAEAVAKLVRERRPKVVIVDGINRLRRSNDVTRDILPLIRELVRLKRELGISILITAQSHPPPGSQNLAIGDLRSLKTIATMADSVFAIAPGRARGGYIKQLKSYSSEVLYDATHALSIKMSRVDEGTRLGFEFPGITTESSARDGTHPHLSCPIVDEAKELRDSGLTIRAIAEQMGRSKTDVHRLLQRWKPPHQRCPEDHGSTAATAEVQGLADTRAPHEESSGPQPNGATGRILRNDPVDPDPEGGFDVLAYANGERDELEAWNTPGGWNPEAETSSEHGTRNLEPGTSSGVLPLATHEPMSEWACTLSPLGECVTAAVNTRGTPIWVVEFQPNSPRPRIWYQYTTGRRITLHRWEHRHHGNTSESVATIIARERDLPTDARCFPEIVDSG